MLPLRIGGLLVQRQAVVVLNAPPDEPIENILFLPVVLATATPMLADVALQS
ncbi:MAG: hypothetical protein IPO38_15180 [Rhodocyclaceae bacterium]|nr:hypothetical protein [Rhodocyclaceae bacterium]